MAQLDISCRQVKHPVPGMSYIRIPMDSPHPPTSQTIVKAIGCQGCSPQPDDKLLLLDNTKGMLSNMVKLNWCPARNFNSYWLAFMVLEDTLHAAWGEK